MVILLANKRRNDWAKSIATRMTWDGGGICNKCMVFKGPFGWPSWYPPQGNLISSHSPWMERRENENIWEGPKERPFCLGVTLRRKRKSSCLAKPLLQHPLPQLHHQLRLYSFNSFSKTSVVVIIVVTCLWYERSCCPFFDPVGGKWRSMVQQGDAL